MLVAPFCQPVSNGVTSLSNRVTGFSIGLTRLNKHELIFCLCPCFLVRVINQFAILFLKKKFRMACYESKDLKYYEYCKILFHSKIAHEMGKNTRMSQVMSFSFRYKHLTQLFIHSVSLTFSGCLEQNLLLYGLIIVLIIFFS